MKKLCALSLIFLFFFASVGQAQPLYLHWTKFFGGTMSESLRDAVSTRDGGIVFTGFTSSIDGDVPYSPPDTLNGLRYNLMVGKIDSNKQLSWTKVYGGQQMDIGCRVIQLTDGGYAVLGYTESSDGDISWKRGSNDIWLLRLDSLGDLLWERTFGSTYSDQSISIAQTSDSSFIILGRSNGFDYDVPFHYGTSQFDYDFLVLKVNSSGNLIWSKTIGGEGNESSTGSIFEAGGGYYIASGSTSRDNECIDTSWCPNINTDYDYYLFFMDTSGNIQWAKSYGGTGGEGVYNAFWDERDSSIVMVGTATSSDYMVGQSYPQISSIWVTKTDKDGNLFWGRRLGDTIANNYWPNIMPIPFGYMVSCTYLDVNQTYNLGSNDALLYLLDTTGNILSEKVIGGIKGDDPKAIMSYRNGYGVIGTSKSYSFTEGVNENANHTNNLQTDIFLSELDELPLSVKVINVNGELQVYPNPARDKVRVELPTNAPQGTLTITDVQGKAVYRERTTHAVLDIKTAAWEKGVYMVEWAGDGYSTVAGKLVLE